MQSFEYKVVPAPRRGEKARGAKTTAERFAYALSQLMNTMAQQGWEYVRADTLPCEERVGLTGKATAFQNMLVFRRLRAEAAVAESASEAAPVMSVIAPEGAPPRLSAPKGASPAAPAVGPAREAAE